MVPKMTRRLVKGRLIRERRSAAYRAAGLCEFCGAPLEHLGSGPNPIHSLRARLCAAHASAERRFQALWHRKVAK